MATLRRPAAFAALSHLLVSPLTAQDACPTPWRLEETLRLGSVEGSVLPWAPPTWRSARMQDLHHPVHDPRGVRLRRARAPGRDHRTRG